MPSTEVLALLRDPGFDPTATVLLDATGEAEKRGGTGLAQITHDGVNEVIVEAQSPDGGWLVLADTYFPGWRVEVDGQPAELLRANFVFRAVRLEPGSHTVRFYYRPRSFLIGGWLSLIGLLGVGALALFPGLGRAR